MILIEKYKWLILVIVLIGGYFYWYEWRPAEIRKRCIEVTADVMKDGKYYGYKAEQERTDFLYKGCLKLQGLKE